MTVSAPERTGKSAPDVTPAARNPRFIVQHTTPSHWQLVDVQASSTAKSVVAEYSDFEAAKATRDRLNRLYVFFGLAETQLLMSDLIEASARDDADWFEELVREFDRQHAEAAGR